MVPTHPPSRSRRRSGAALGFLVALLAGLDAQAQSGAPPQHRVAYRNLTVVRLNPTGLLDEARINYRYRLYQHESLALRDNFVSLGLAPSFSPAFARLGVVVELQPASVIQLWAMYEAAQYFGGFNLMQSFPSARSDFADSQLDRLGELPAGDPGRNYATSGSQLTLGVNLQAKVGPVAVRTQLRFIRPDLKLRGGDQVFYDQIYDVLAPNRGWFLTNDADLLYQTAFGLTAGIRWTATSPQFGARHYAEGEPLENNSGPMHRLGPLIAYTFFTEDGARLNTPTVLLLVNWWLAHRYRTGAEVSPAIPYLAAGFAFTGDLLPSK